MKLSQQKIRRREGKSYLFSQEARERRDMIAASYIEERKKAHDKCMDEAEKAFEKFQHAGAKRPGEPDNDWQI